VNECLRQTTYVGIERAVVLGPEIGPVEGQVYVAQPDRSLRPITGKELVELHEKYPEFVKNWKLYD
jgi:hypothetical protein